MKTKFVIIGGRGGAVVLGEQIYDAQLKGSPVEFLGYAFDDETLGDDVNGFPIHCKTYEANGHFKTYDDVKFIYQMWRPDLMKVRIELLKSYGIPDSRFGTFVHPSSIVTKSATIGVGSAVLANCVINPNVVIGNHCTIHSNTLVGHDSKMGDYNFIAAHTAIGSNNRIGQANFFGLKSSLNNKVEIGDECFIGMAANVLKNVESLQMVVGNPARQVERKIKPL
jgi:acetyltransferase EpsM